MNKFTRSEIQWSQGFNRRIRTAWHEAGHALYAYYCGAWVKSVSVNRRTASGMCSYTDAYMFTEHQRALQLVSGYVAECMWYERRHKSNDFSDESFDSPEDGCIEDYKSLGPTYNDDDVAELEAEARVFLTAHIKQLAALARLIVRRDVDNDDIERITRTTWRDLPAQSFRSERLQNYIPITKR